MDQITPDFEKMSQYFSLLSEPMRIRILHAICRQERSVGEIAAETGATQTNVSRHLNAMYRAGALARRKEGAFVYYSVADHALTDLCRNVCMHVADSTSGAAVNGASLPLPACDRVATAELRRSSQDKQPSSPGRQEPVQECPAARAPNGSRSSPATGEHPFPQESE